VVDLFCRMLRRIASALQAFAARHDGFAARYDGEEFTLLFAVDTETGGAFLADRLVRMVRELSIPHPARLDRLPAVTVSVGYAGTGESGVREVRVLVTRADLTLYEAKSAGRNRSKAGEAHLPVREETSDFERGGLGKDVAD
jgi:diguanylate cyclase (GGDEF)-like protein